MRRVKTLAPELLAAWQKGSDRGYGWTPCGGRDLPPQQAAAEMGWEVLQVDFLGCVLARDELRQIVVCGARVPYAVEVPTSHVRQPYESTAEYAARMLDGKWRTQSGLDFYAFVRQLGARAFREDSGTRFEFGDESAIVTRNDSPQWAVA